MPPTSSTIAYYVADVTTFYGMRSDEILGGIAASSGFAIETTQRDAWLVQIEVLKSAFADIKGRLFLEFVVPRIGSRIDAVFVSGSTVFVIEFKVGEATFNRGDRNQVWDYALDLKNFHRASHNAAIVPILVATHAEQSDSVLPDPAPDNVFPPTQCNSSGLRQLILEGLKRTTGSDIDPQLWGDSCSWL